MSPPPPRFGGRLPMPLGMPPRMPPHAMGPMFGPMRQRMIPPRPVGMMRPGCPPLPPPPLFGPRARGVPPLMPPMMGPRGLGPRGPLMRPGPRGLLPPQGLPHMRPRFPIANGGIKMKIINNAKKASKLEELELKKPWMTDEIRDEIQKRRKLYAKAKKNKDAKEWEEFKDLRNKVTRMIKDAKNEFLAINPEQAHLYENDEEAYDNVDENYSSSEGDETSHYCEVCDREFVTIELLERHNDTHKTCGIDGCTFSAHPKLVEKHITMQHYTGLYHKMKNLSTPEDIEKWIVERKKKYPTKLNVERKKAELIEKQERGEVIVKAEKSRVMTKPAKEKKRRIRNRRPREFRDKPAEIVELYRGLLPFAGIADLRANVNKIDDEQSEIMEKTEDAEMLTAACAISDDEDETNKLQHSVDSFQFPEGRSTDDNKSGLASLLANYGGDTDSQDEGPEEVPIKRMKTVESPENVSLRVPSSKITESANDTQKIIQDVAKSTSVRGKSRRPFKDDEKSSKEEKSRDFISKKTDNTRYRNQKRLMLLQRLLSRSIQHERNLICQCIKYIADNNFFDE